MNELLAGPFNFVRVQDGATVSFGSVNSNVTANQKFWADDVGLCGMVVAPQFPGDIYISSSSGSGYYIAQLDGSTYKRSSYKTPGKMVLDLQRPGEYLYNSGAAIKLFDKQAGDIGAAVISGGVNSVYDLQVRCADRWLYFTGSAVKTRGLDNVGSYTVEATLSLNTGGYPVFSLTEGPNVICICYTTGQVMYYDVVQKKQVRDVKWIGVNQGAWYSPKFGIFVVLVSSQLKVFATTARPASLSAVTVVDPIVKGRVSNIKVRLLGDHSDACANELVGWSITSGPGALLKAQSTTDANGYAYNQYVAPLTLSTSPVIQAQVVF